MAMGKVLGVLLVSAGWSFLVAVLLTVFGSQVQGWLANEAVLSFLAAAFTWAYSLGIVSFVVFWIADFIVTVIALCILVGFFMALGFK
jgi:hypothetical protein